VKTKGRPTDPEITHLAAQLGISRRLGSKWGKKRMVQKIAKREGIMAASTLQPHHVVERMVMLASKRRIA
jgi:hypothetical protein